MHRHKTYSVSMGRAWSINHVEFYTWLRKELAKQAEAPDTDEFCCDMEGWRELSRRPAWWMTLNLSKATVGEMRDMLGEYQSRRDSEVEEQVAPLEKAIGMRLDGIRKFLTDNP